MTTGAACGVESWTQSLRNALDFLKTSLAFRKVNALRATEPGNWSSRAGGASAWSGVALALH